MLAAVFVLVHALVPGEFEASCTSSENYGWPRFETRADLEASGNWTSYFVQVYGALPDSYPVCVYDFWTLNATAYAAAGLSPTRKVLPSHQVREGDLYSQQPGALGIYHGEWRAAPNHTWVEVAHSVVPTERMGAWVWRTRGSGVWFNVGRTLVFPTPSETSHIHQEAIAFLSAGCSRHINPLRWPQLESDVFGFCAREKGYDSIQFEPQAGQSPIGTFNLTGLTEMVMVNLDGYTRCGVANASATPLRVGWRASERCECVDEPMDPACGLMPTCVFPLGCSPRMCEQHEGPWHPPWHPFRPCDPGACAIYSPGMCRAAGGRPQHQPADQAVVQTAAVAAAAAAAKAVRATMKVQATTSVEERQFE